MDSVQLRNIIDNTTSLRAVHQKLHVESPHQGVPRTLEQTITESVSTESSRSEISEEQLQHGLTKHILDEIHPEAGSDYLRAFHNAQQSGASDEDAVKLALQDIAASGILTLEEAEKINGLTFRAAQLDDNLEALYDGRGGPDDLTIATATMKNAVAQVEETLLGMQEGRISVTARALDEPSNIAPNSGHTALGVIRGGGDGEFLWKPQSESDGKLVVLLPSRYSGQIAQAGIYSSLPPSRSNLIEQGRFTGDTHNGGRAHFRFNKSGEGYPDGVHVVAMLKNGESVSFPIGESSIRN